MPRLLDPQGWQPLIKQALQGVRRPPEHPPHLRPLYLYSQCLLTAGGNAAQAREQWLRQGMGVLAERNPAAYELLDRQFFQGESTDAMAARLNFASSSYFRHQGLAIAELTAILLDLEAAAYAEQRKRMVIRLEMATYQTLIAAEEPLARLQRLLAPDTQPWLVALVGMGGIGKTSLADALVRRMLDTGEWHQIAWVTARQQSFALGGTIRPSGQPVLTAARFLHELYSQINGQGVATLTPATLLARLREQLTLTPHLIVVDNLEAVADLADLLPVLRQLSQPSKFLLTTREGLISEGDIAHIAVDELSQAAALQLVRSEATARNLVHVQAATDGELTPLYTTVGGNPLALRLVIGQLHIFALADILADLVAKRGLQVDALYRYIYQQAWSQLTEPARLALLAMLLVPEEGGPFAYLTHLDPTLTAADWREALQQLVTLSLVERRGDLQQARYAIHNLTRTFLHEVIAW